MKSKRAFSVFLILALVFLMIFLSPHKWMKGNQDDSAHNHPAASTLPRHPAAAHATDATDATDAHAATKRSPEEASDNAAETPQKLTTLPQTSSSRRIIPTAKKPIKDILASWEIQSPWPEGPRLMVDVESSDTRYVNLRPNEQGIMPRLYVKTQETLQVKLSMPDSHPGETIFLELPNGGTFPDQELRGKTLLVSDHKTINFTINASALRGHCTISIRQAGHTRTLPLWVGAPLPPPRDEIADPNRPTS